MTTTTRLTVTNCADCNHQHYVANSCANPLCMCERFTRTLSDPPPQEETGNERPAYKFTRARQDEYLEKLREGMGRTKAAFEVGINRRTVEREIAKANGFTQERDDAEMFRDDSVEEGLFNAAVSGNPNAAKYWLEHHRPEWRHKADPLPGSSPATPLYIAPGQIDWDNLPDDLADELLAVHAKIVALQPASGGFVVDADEYHEIDHGAADV